MLRSRKLCLAVGLLMSAFLLQGVEVKRSITQYAHRIWQMQQGLPQPTVLTVSQTADGYLWLGTQSGAVRFDGVRFTAVDQVGGIDLTNTWVREITEDRDHRLWMGTNVAGLLRVEGEAAKQFTEADGLPSRNVHCVLPGRQGETWVCTSAGMARVVGDRVENLTASDGVGHRTIRAGCLDGQGRPWIGVDGPEIDHWNGERFDRITLRSVPREATVRAILCTREGEVWAGTTRGLVSWKAGVERWYAEKDGLPDSWIHSLRQGRDGDIWIGTDNGFSRWSGSGFENYRVADGLSQRTVYSIFEDREGSIWAGTKYGLNQFLEGRVIPYTHREGLPSDATGPVLEDGAGSLWAGTLGGGLARFAEGRFRAAGAGVLPGKNIYALADGPEGELWVGTETGLHQLRRGQLVRSWGTAQGLPAATVRSIFRDRDGVVWVGTAAGPVRIQGDLVQRPEGVAWPAHKAATAIGRDRNGAVFIASEGGQLFIYEHRQLRELNLTGVPVREISSFFLDNAGLLWMGTLGGGLRLLRDGKIHSFWMSQGLFDDEILGVVEDDRGRLWMGCSKGIFSVKKADLLRFLHREIPRFVSSPYTPMDALRIIECQNGVQPAVWRQRDGNIWFSTIRGLLAIDPRRLDAAPNPPPALIESITVNGDQRGPAELSALAPDNNNLEFRYTAMTLRQATRATFQYRLQGFDQRWIEAASRREARYTNLPPGRYTFQVKACTSDGLCGEPVESRAFELLPHYYQRPWVLALFAGLLMATVWAAHQLRIRRLRDKYDLILAERSRIARELHDTLIQGFSGVTMEMQALQHRLKEPEQRSSLAEIIEDSATALREARRSVAGLRSGATDASGLASAIAETAKQLTETKSVRLDLRLDRTSVKLPADVEYNLLRIVQEAITNALRHADPQRIEVTLQAKGDRVRLAVKDDGRGADLGAASGKPGHYGLVGMRERASQIGANLEIDSEVGVGTTVSVLTGAYRS